jgi:hypothetical protein
MSLVHASPSSQTEGHRPGPSAIATSQVSSTSTLPLPQVISGGQSPSLAEVAPAGQHPSSTPSRAGAMTQCTEHGSVAASWTRSSTVHALASSHEVGHAPALPAAMAVSQRSPWSSTPSPQRGAQSLSSSWVARTGQQPSPLSVATIVTARHSTRQGPSSTRVGRSHEPGSGAGHEDGQSPSQRSPTSTTPLPHDGCSSMSSRS